MTALPYPHARNDCQVCRERDADFEVHVKDPVTPRRRPSLLCQRCLGPWSVTQVHLLDDRAVMTLEWASGRLADQDWPEVADDHFDCRRQLRRLCRALRCALLRRGRGAVRVHLRRHEPFRRKQQAIDNTRQVAESWLEQARACGQGITHAEMAIDGRHQPLFDLGSVR